MKQVAADETRWCKKPGHVEGRNTLTWPTSLPEHWRGARRGELWFSLVRKERFGYFIIISGLPWGHSLVITEKERCQNLVVLWPWTHTDRNNRGKTGSNLGGNKPAVHRVFPLQHAVTFTDNGGEIVLLYKQSYPYLEDCHGLLLSCCQTSSV